MKNGNWTLENLKSHLNARKTIKGWIIVQEHLQRRERYFLREGKALAIDQDRLVNMHSLSAKLMIQHPDRPDRQGEITKKLFPALSLSEQIDSAIESALQTDHQTWSLPAEIPAQLPQLKSSDPRIGEDIEKVMQQLTAQIEQAVSKSRKSEFNSAELFLSNHARELHVSNGLTHRYSQSRVYVEAAYSFRKANAQGEMQSDEYLSTQWAVSLDDLPIQKLFEETADHAEHSLDTEKPPTAHYPVIVSADVLATLFNGHVSQLTAVNAYNGLPSLKVGSDFIPNAKGDLLTITLDPTLDFGADTLAVSSQGVAQRPLKLVEKNRVLACAADRQHAEYLKIAPSTIRGSVVVEPGSLSYAELKTSAPRVLEILQFSGLFADPNSGTFSSEIRLARLYDNVTGETKYIKGGSLSGSIVDNFQGIKLSKNRVKHAHFSAGSPDGQGYFGPEHALLSNVSVVS